MSQVCREHGGGCCGIRHIYGFYILPTPENIARFDKTMNDYELSPGMGLQDKLIEVVLNNSETKQEFKGMTWMQVLRERGFKLVNRSRNSNGSVLHIFHRGCSDEWYNATKTRRGAGILNPPNEFPHDITDRV